MMIQINPKCDETRDNGKGVVETKWEEDKRQNHSDGGKRCGREALAAITMRLQEKERIPGLMAFPISQPQKFGVLYGIESLDVARGEP